MHSNSEIERGFRPQLHYFAMLFLWLALVVTILLYFYFVKANIWRPHVAWWILTFGSIVASAVFAGLLVVARFWRRSHRTWAIGIFMLTVAPLVFFGAFIWLVFSLSQQRGDLQLSLPVRAFGIWGGNYFDLEARWKNPRLTNGKHVQLFDDGQIADPNELVSKMDEHIVSMAKTLGREPTDWKLAWARSSLAGQSGRAVGLWAICPFRKSDTRNKSINELGFVDEHEVAHTLITSLCEIDQDPPMLLVEGWAMTQSPSQPIDLSNLQRMADNDETWTLVDLVSERFYGRSIGPAYNHGGPLVTYLLERFGGPRFLELYGGVSRSTFLADAERILGISWQQLDSDFWKWLDQHKKSPESRVTFADDSLEPLWEQIIASAKQHQQQELENRPTSYGFQIEVQDGGSEISRVVIEGDEGWFFSELDVPQGASNTYSRRGPADDCFFFYLHDDNTSNQGEFNLRKGDSTVRYLFETALNATRGNAFDYKVFYHDAKRPTFEVLSITPGENPTDPWELCYRNTWRVNNTKLISALLDPTEGFSFISFHRFSQRFERVQEFEIGNFLGRQTAVVTKSTNLSKTIGRESEYTTTELIRELTADEITEVKQQVDNIAESGSGLKVTNWNKRIVNPYTLAFGWPILAFLILGIDLIGEKVKIKVRPDNRSQRLREISDD